MKLFTILLLFVSALAAQSAPAAPNLINVVPATPASVAIAPAPGLSCTLSQHVAAVSGSGVDVACTVDSVSFSLPNVPTGSGFGMSFSVAGNQLSFTLQSATANGSPTIAWTASATLAGSPTQSASGNF